MTNETIASRIVDLVKGIFGQKEPAASQPAPKGAEPAAADEAEPAEAAAAESQDSAEEAATGEEQAEEAPEPLVGEGDKDAVAEELASAEAKTVTASRESLDNAKAAAEGTAPSGDLPVPNYASVTIASMRARLRKLSLEDVQTLRDYEAANDNRADFLKMYDNRIAKLESEG